tara:strand:- start:8549 stop:8755 length:207 start_codon:yes stop_codon:yes gene_type:complete
MSEENKKLFTITAARKSEEGVELDFDLSEEFVERFKKEQNLKKWSKKRFDEWVTQNIDVLLKLLEENK